jgi:hypothetical protein
MRCVQDAEKRQALMDQAKVLSTQASTAAKVRACLRLSQRVLLRLVGARGCFCVCVCVCVCAGWLPEAVLRALVCVCGGGGG